jgi:hypothetical protein
LTALTSLSLSDIDFRLVAIPDSDELPPESIPASLITVYSA